MTREVKAELVAEIAALVGCSVPAMSTGSSEPRAIFEIVNDRLSLGLDPRLGKPQLARAIVEASGGVWHPDYESRGARVTLSGLRAVRDAVRFFLS